MNRVNYNMTKTDQFKVSAIPLRCYFQTKNQLVYIKAHQYRTIKSKIKQEINDCNETLILASAWEPSELSKYHFLYKLLEEQVTK